MEAFGACEVAKILSLGDMIPSDNVGDTPLGGTGLAEDHIFVAFLRSSAVEGGPVCGCYPGNWIKQKYTGGNFMHVQPFFIHNGKIVSFTVDSEYMCVHAVENKTFSRKEWEFFAIHRPRDKLESMWAYACAQVDKPYNSTAMCDFLCLDIAVFKDTKFHCAQFTTRVLQEGGLFTTCDARYVSDMDLHHKISGLKVAKHNPAINIETGELIDVAPSASDNLYVRMRRAV